MEEDQGLTIDVDVFKSQHKFERHINTGGEGAVALWKENSGTRLVAVKLPAVEKEVVRNALRREIIAMNKLGSHPHIVKFLGASVDWHWRPPLIFYDFCDLGDAHDYAYKIHRTGIQVPELTLWKFLRDMTKALDFLHNSFGVQYVHGDLKPQNILISRPPGDNSPVPLAPTFRLADISHLNEYKRRDRGPHVTFCGTWEFGPPMEERKARIAPPVDIYALGASLQTLAWGLVPIQSRKKMREALIADYDTNCASTNETLTDIMNSDAFRRRHIVVYRPLNASEEDQITKYDMKHSFPPYSTTLNEWYTMCMHEDPTKRVTARVLKEQLLPLAESQFRLHKAKHDRDQKFKKIAQLKAERSERIELRSSEMKYQAMRRTREENDRLARQVERRAATNKGPLNEAERDDGKAKKKFDRFID
jgi:serine/threonine protein kinase